MTIGCQNPNDLAVLVCAHLLDGDDHTGTIGCEVTPIADLCRFPERIEGASGGHSRVVVISCDRGPSRADVQSKLIKARVDLTVAYIQFVTPPVPASDLVSLIRGCVARVTGERAAIQPVWRSDLSQGLSRRNLLRIQAPEKVSLPVIDSAGCVSAEGCRACMDVCPSLAVAIDSSGITIDPAMCSACGLCLPLCPTSAIIDGSTTPGSISAQVEAFLDLADDTGTRRHGISFVCRHAAAVSLEEGWWPVQVTSLGVVTAAWLLTPLLMGSVGVSLPRCDICEGFANIDARVEIAQRVAAAVGWHEGVVSRRGSAPELQPVEESDLTAPFGQVGAVEVFAEIARQAQTSFRLEQEESPLGQVAIGDACTGSFLCASVCPTDALTTTVGDDGIAVQFDAGLCTACGHCLNVCPEVEQGSITVTRVVDFEALRAGRRTLRTHASAACESCGAPLEAIEMLNRVSQMLKDSDDRTIANDLARCPRCLESSVVASGRALLR